MQEVFSKIIDKLKEKSIFMTTCDGYGANCVSVGTIEEIVKHEAEKFGTDINVGRNGWIPVEEEFPKTDEYILLSFSNFSIPLVGRYEEDENGGTFYVGDETEPCVKQDIFVNAWMHLPSPYQPKGE